ncbi:peptidoglycan DD-metalloendopeptidase family protein [Microcoleus sp. S13_C3]
MPLPTTEQQWDLQTGDGWQFDDDSSTGGKLTNIKEASPEVKQLSRELSQKLVGFSATMTAGYAYINRDVLMKITKPILIGIAGFVSIGVAALPISAALLNETAATNKTQKQSSPPQLLAQGNSCIRGATVSPAFTARTSSGPVNIRSGPSLSASVVGTLPGNQTFRFDGWAHGDTVMDAGFNPPRPDARWYKLEGQNRWVASAVVVGNAPNSTPTCTPSGGGYFNNLASWNDSQWENAINSASALNSINNNPNSDLGRIYRDLSNDLFGRYFPLTGAYISDDYFRATGGRLGFHGGIDIGTPVGTEVKSMVDGTVVIAQRNSNGSTNQDGILTIKAANGTNYIYMHLSEIRVTQNQQVRKGAVLGKTGAMGGGRPNAFAPHLHYEVARPDFPWGSLQRPAATTKDQFRQRTFNPLKNYWELRRR